MEFRDKDVDIKGGRKIRPKIYTRGMTEVICALQMDDITRKAWLLVSLRSCVKPDVQNHIKVDADRSERKLEAYVRYAAETLAGFQCINHGDQHNPKEIANLAVEALRDIRLKAKNARQAQKI